MMFVTTYCPLLQLVRGGSENDECNVKIRRHLNLLREHITWYTLVTEAATMIQHLKEM